MAKRMLVRADDLGWTEAINYGIEKTVKEGIIGSVGLMPNMPAARHGMELLAGENVCVGQHTNICVGRPVTDPEKIPSLCQDNGLFKPSRAYRTAREDFVVLDEVVLEIEAVIFLRGWRLWLTDMGFYIFPWPWTGRCVFAVRGCMRAWTV